MKAIIASIYRVKGQGEYWSKTGAELNVLTERELQAAARDSLKKRHEAHLGIQHGALTTQVADSSYLSDLGRHLGHTNI